MPRKTMPWYFLIIVIFNSAALLSYGDISDLSWPDCDPLQASEFSMERLVGKSSANNPRTVDSDLTEPIKLAFDMDEAGNVDVYWVERLGGVKRYSVADNTVTKLGQLNPTTDSNEGLVGIALDPDFKENGWIYLYYSIQAEYRVSRFTLVGNSLDMSSEVALLKIPIDVGKLHTGGAMTFDGYGSLWIAVGDNAAGERGAANSNDLRGSILRINPTPEGTYTIPEGNWRETLEDSYSESDLDKIKPEIYVKGTRNPYTIDVDPVRRWLAWGDVGPDWYTSSDNAHPTEEHDLVTEPGYMGWPYFAGTNICNGNCSKDPDGPTVNYSNHDGISRLPPAIPAINAYPRSGAMTGPIYRYDGESESSIKLPPHFHRKWIISDFRSRYEALTLNEEATEIIDRATIFEDLTCYNCSNQNTVLDLKQGPEGALYVINYNGWYTTDPTTNIARFEYSGSCLPDEPKLEVVGGVGVSKPQSERFDYYFRGEKLFVDHPGHFNLSLFTPDGRETFKASGSGAEVFTLPKLKNSGIKILVIQNEHGTISKIVSR